MSIADLMKPKDKEPEAIRALRIRAQEAGLQPGTPAYNAFMLNAGVPSKGTSLSISPEGGVEFNQGGVDGGMVAPIKPGTAPAGYGIIPSPSSPGGVSMVPIEGGPAEREIKLAEEAKTKKAENKATTANVVTGTIGAIRDTLLKPRKDAAGNILRDPQGNIISDRGMFDLPEVGVRGAKLADMGVLSNQEAVNIKNQLDTMSGAVAFDTLTKMREASPTGGALGAVSDTEMTLLSAALGTLKNDNDPEVLLRSLDTIEQVMQKFAAYPNAGDFGLAESGGEAPLLSPDEQSVFDKYAN